MTRHVMKLTAGVVIVALTLTASILHGQQSARQIFERARILEEANQDLMQAIRLYEQAAAQAVKTDRALAAQALIRMAESYRKLGSNESQKIYERIVREFADQKEVASDASRRLATLESVRPDILTARLVWSGSEIDGGASISADGRLLAMVDWSTGDLAIRDMSTGQTKRLMAKTGSWDESPQYGQTPVLSPDLRQVVYAWSDGPHFELRVMANESGGKQRVLVTNPEFTYFIPSAWSPDGKSILTTIWKQDNTGQLAWISATDGAVKTLKSLEWRLPRYVESRPSLSPDGQYLAYSALERPDLSESSIFVMAADGSRETALVKNGSINEAPMWTPDGKHLVYTSNRGGTFGLWSVEVQEGRAAAVPMRVKSEIGRTPAIGFTRSGSYYYINVGSAEEGNFIADLDPTTGFPRGPVVPAGSSLGAVSPALAWSPDGKSIALAMLNEVVVRNIETGETAAIKPTGVTALAGSIAWFHDGKTLLQAGRDAQSRINFYRVGLETKEFKQVLATGATSDSLESALSPDERTLYTNAGETGKGHGSRGIAAFDLATGRKTQVFVAKDDGIVPGLALSPDGRMLAFRLYYPGKLNEQHLCVIGVDGNGFRDVYTEDEPSARAKRAQVAWTKDGGSILFTRATNEGWQLMRIPAKGGTAQFMRLAGKGIPGINLNADGSRIAFNNVVSGSNTELWALDNLISALKADR